MQAGIIQEPACSTQRYHVIKTVVALVGLPARNKTFIARNLAHFLRWIGVPTMAVSVAHLRRQEFGCELRADFFDPKNADSLAKRTMIADKALDILLEWLEGDAMVGILDASNTTRGRRRKIQETFAAKGIRVLFVECVWEGNDEAAMVLDHLKQMRLTNSAEYGGLSLEDSCVDFQHRIDFYRPDYQPLSQATDGADQPFIRLIENAMGKRRIEVNALSGYLPTRMLHFLMMAGARPCPHRRIWLASNGHAEGTKMADEDLSPAGWLHAQRLSQFFANTPLQIWTSPRRRSYRTAHWSPNCLQKIQLDDLNPGDTDGLSEAEIAQAFPLDHQLHQKDPFHHRYPRAESYHDLVVRLEPVIMELEKGGENLSTLIIADLTVLRCLHGYFLEGTRIEDLTKLNLSQDELIELTPCAYGCYERRINLLTMQESQPSTFKPHLEHY